MNGMNAKQNKKQKQIKNYISINTMVYLLIKKNQKKIHRIRIPQSIHDNATTVRVRKARKQKKNIKKTKTKQKTTQTDV